MMQPECDLAARFLAALQGTLALKPCAFPPITITSHMCVRILDFTDTQIRRKH